MLLSLHFFAARRKNLQYKYTTKQSVLQLTYFGFLRFAAVRRNKVSKLKNSVAVLSSEIRPSFTQWLFPFCPPSDYCLTTISRKPGKPWEPRRTKGSHVFCKSVLNLCDVSETRINSGFLPWRPDNSDSVGRWFESSRAHQALQGFPWRVFVCRKPLARRVVPKKACADDEDRKTPFVVK